MSNFVRDSDTVDSASPNAEQVLRDSSLTMVGDNKSLSHALLYNRQRCDVRKAQRQNIRGIGWFLASSDPQIHAHFSHVARKEEPTLNKPACVQGNKEDEAMQEKHPREKCWQAFYTGGLCLLLR